MTKGTLFLLSVIMVMALLTSCDKSATDDTAPVVSLLGSAPEPFPDTICGAVEPVVFHVRSGDTLAVDLMISDDVALSQYKIDIHSNFDCHGHKLNTEDWSVVEIGNLSGQEQVISRWFKVPSYVTAGEYHFQIQAIDKAGNDDPLANIYAIKVMNDTDEEAPVLSLDNPNPDNGRLSLRKGQSYTFSGLVRDNYSLWRGGNGRLEFFYRSMASGNTFRWGAPLIFAEADGVERQFSVTLLVPPTLSNGEYQVSVWAYDGVNNAAKPVYYSATITN
jgi:hypothetical protein